MKHLFIAIFAFAILPAAHAADAVPAGASETQSKHFIPEEIYTDLFTNYHGSSLKEFDSSRQLDHEGKRGKPGTSNFDSELGVGYQLTESVKVGAVVPFLAFPTGNDSFSLGDVGLKVSHANTINWNGFKVSTNLILQAPTSDYSKARGQGVAIKTTPYARYEIPNSDFTLAAFNEIKDYTGVNSGKVLKVWTMPHVKYRLNKSVSFMLGYELELDHFKGSSARLSHYQHDLQPGVVWNITKKISVNPYLQFFNLGAINTANTGFGTVINAALL